MRDRVTVRDRLHKLGMVQVKQNVCLICNEGKEESIHLYVQCDRLYKVWANVKNLWNMNFMGA